MHHTADIQCAPMRLRAFSLVELVIVIVIIGIIAAIAVPRFSTANHKAMARTIAADLRVLNDVALHYNLEHDCPLGISCEDSPSESNRIDHRFLTSTTTRTGEEDGDLGPYLRAVPVNPIIGTSNIFSFSPYEAETPPAEISMDGGFTVGAWHYGKDVEVFNVYVDPDVMRYADLIKLAAPAPIEY